MGELLVLAPSGFIRAEEVAPAILLEFRSFDEVQAAFLGRYDGAVFVSDGIPADRLAVVAGSVRGAGYPVIEVQSHPWRGEEHSPLTAACRGVIAGFGAHGIRAALEILAEQ
jgi:3-dehydroquinate dehydratase